MAGFDPKDKTSWYFGLVSREEANSILQAESDNGVFLVRDSTTITGDFVVCVKEDNKISHYIVNRMNVSGSTKYRIGEQEFNSLSSLLQYYSEHSLDTTSLRRPAPKLKYRAKFKFPGRDPDDLPFEKNDILTIIHKTEEQWWMAKNERGDTGLVPAPYIQKVTDELIPGTPGVCFDAPQAPLMPVVNFHERKLPARARVVKNRDPNAYDKTALKLKVGDELTVMATHPSGQWEGVCNGQSGIFPFTHIKFIEEEEEEEIALDDSVHATS